MVKNGYSDLHCFPEISDLIDFSTSLNMVFRPYFINYQFVFKNPFCLHEIKLIILTYVEEAQNVIKSLQNRGLDQTFSK